MYNFEGKVAIVTGAGRQRGMGRAIALRLAQEGADIAIVDRVEDSKLREVADEIAKTTKRRVVPIRADITIAKEVDDAVAKVVAALGRVDILVNNAGVITGQGRPVVEMTEEAFDANMNVNAKGTFLFCRSVARELIKEGHGGKILNCSSECGKIGWAGMAGYSAGKAAVLGLTRPLAIELAPYGINVNAYCPGSLDTEIQDEGQRYVVEREGKTYEEVRKGIEDSIPQKRFQTAEEIAGVVAFLASSEADRMTGQAINITGGRTMC